MMIDSFVTDNRQLFESKTEVLLSFFMRKYTHKEERAMGMYDNQYYRTGINSYTPGYAIPQQNPSGILWVQGETGAKSWMLPPNSTVLLMDSEKQQFYIKTTDGSGMPSMRVFTYSERQTPTEPKIGDISDHTDNYCTRQEYAEILARCTALEEIVKDITRPKKAVKKNEVLEDE